MVGVPGRSRACYTCKKRRVACDAARPQCGQCIKSKRVCDGYPDGHIFVHNEANSHRTIYKKSANDAAQAAQTTPETGNNRNGKIDSSFLVLGQLPQAVSVAALMQQQLISHAIGSVSAEYVLNQPLLHVWRSMLHEVAESPLSMHAAPLACYLAWLSRRDEVPYLAHGGRQLYVRGIGEVVKGLRDADVAMKNETLTACISLAMYETIECPEASMRGYHAHVRGCLSLIERRGPEAHQEGSAYLLFMAIRMLGSLDALEQRRANFLSSEQWMTIPWKKHPKGNIDRLIDILLLGPAVFQRADALKGMAPEQALPELASLIEHCAMIDLKLEAYYRHLQESLLVPMYWELPANPASSQLSREISEDGLEMFPSAYHFGNLEDARVITGYWATRCLLLTGVTDLYAGLERDGIAQWVEGIVSPAALNVLMKRREYFEMAQNICRSIEYCTLTQHNGAGSLRIAMPIDIAIGTLRGRKGAEKVLQWLLRVREEVGQRWLRLLSHEDN